MLSSIAAPQIVFSDNLKWTGLAGIQLANLPDTVEIDSHTLLRKSEFHITLMAGKFLGPMLDSQNSDHALQLLKESFVEFSRTHDLTQFHLARQLYAIRREERFTVVAMVDMPVLKELFDHLRANHGVDFPTQPAHITLYTLQPDAGIWLTSQQEVVRDGTPIEIAQLADLATVSS